MQWAFKIEQRQQITVLYFCYVERVRGPLPVYIWVWAPSFHKPHKYQCDEVHLGTENQRNTSRKHNAEER